MNLKAIVFDLGNTLIYQKIDSEQPLNEMELKLIPQAKEVLEILRKKKYKLGLLSNTTQSSSEHVHEALIKIGIADYFETIITSFDLGVEKPNPLMFYAILKRLGVKPEESVMVGNDPVQDVEGARRVGMITVFFTQNNQADSLHKCCSPDASFTALSELPTIIEKMEASGDK